MNYYTHEKLTKHLYRIIDCTGVCCYLAVGSKRACLLDTCNGLGNIKDYIKKITNLPTFVILTHGHLDHMGGAGLFDLVYMNHEDLPIFIEHANMDFRVKNTMENAHIDIQEADLVKTFDVNLLKDIQDQEIFDLGDLRIEMLLVKGHTPGIMCPLIIEDRAIIFGDACGEAVLLFDEHSSCVSEYQKSLRYLKTFATTYDNIYRNHGSFYSNKILLDNVLECCDLILNHQDDHIPVKIHGYDLFATKEFNERGRLDKKEGNILYSVDKAK